MKRPIISDETIAEVAQLNREQRFNDHYREIQSVIEKLSEKLPLVADYQGCEVNISIDDWITLSIRYPDGALREFSSCLFWLNK